MCVVMRSNIINRCVVKVRSNARQLLLLRTSQIFVKILIINILYIFYYEYFLRVESKFITRSRRKCLRILRAFYKTTSYYEYYELLRVTTN